MKDLRIAFIPGDGIGVEVTQEAIKALRTLQEAGRVRAQYKVFDWGAEKYLREKVALPAGALPMLQRDFDAIFVGALGDPRVPSNQHAADILLGIRFGLDLYVNQRPVRLLHECLCPLKNRKTSDVNLMIFRENTEGPYVGAGGNLRRGTADEVAIQEDVNTRKGVERILVYAFEHARSKGLKRVCMSDKSNAMPHAHGLWQRVFADVRSRYPEVESRHLFIDTLAMELVRDPSQFQVIVTCNLFGDIISDLGAQLQGGMGLAPSANIHPGRTSMFETVHGSAPAIAGKGIANPMAAFLTLGMLLEHCGYVREAARLEEVVKMAINSGRTTPDLSGRFSTSQVGDWLCEKLKQ